MGNLLRNLLKRPRVNKAVKWLAKHWPKYYCKIYGHLYLVDINKDRDEMTLHHQLRCGHCRVLFGLMDFPYALYAVRGVNPQYGMALKKWIHDEVGVSFAICDKLIENVQKFRNRSQKVY